MSIPLRPRSTSELVDAAFQLLRGNYAQYVTLMAIGYVPLVIIQMLFSRAGANTGLGSAFGASRVIFSFLFAVLWYTLIDAVLILAVSDSYLGRPVDIGASFRTATSRLGDVIVSGLAKTLLIGVGLLFFIIPGFYFLAKYFAVPATIVIEGRTAGEGLSRSSTLSEGLKGHILKTFLLIFGIYLLLTMAAGAMAAIFMVVSKNPTLSTMLTQVISAIFRILIYPIVSIVVTLLYYDARIRKEGYDLELMAADLGGARAAV